MRWAVGISAFFLVVVTAIFVQFSSARNGTLLSGISPEKFVVHEWGTFTSFSGSDGVKLEFRPLVENDLPGFVLDREAHLDHMMLKFIKQNQRSKLSMNVLQRMETPVTYFYTDQPRQVKVSVGFPQGLLTEFYPPVDKMLPALKDEDSETMTNSELDWGSIWLIPEDNFQVNVPNAELATELENLLPRRILPGVVQGRPFGTEPVNPYMHARETDSAIVYKDQSFEKFLFYRGVGNFSLPLTLKAKPDGHFELTNSGNQAIPSLFLVTVKGDQLWFQQYPEIMPHQTLALEQAEQEADIYDLDRAVEEALVQQGLYPKEATAMINTWRRSWFREEGTRLFYILPQSKTDKLLPLEIKPAPDEVLRVMVGRMEIMTPEDETRISELVKESMSEREKSQASNPAEKTAVSDIALSKELPTELLKLGRLAEPALVRVKHINTDPDLQAEAELLIRELRWYRDHHANTGL